MKLSVPSFVYFWQSNEKHNNFLKYISGSVVSSLFPEIPIFLESDQILVT